MRKRLDHDINHPLRVIELDLYPKLPYIEIFTTQEEYDAIAIHDPLTIYVIRNRKDGKCYIGDELVNTTNTERMYLIGPANKFGEYVLYLNINNNHYHRLMEICKYDNPQQAINALNTYNKVGSHTRLALEVYNILMRYIDRELGVNDTLLGILSVFGYKDDPRLQELIGTAHMYNNASNNIELSIELRMIITRLSEQSNVLFKFYYDLYNLFILYDFFRGKKYRHPNDEKIDLTEELEKIYKIMY